MALFSSSLLVVAGLAGYVAGREDLAARLKVTVEARLSGPGSDHPRRAASPHGVIGPIPPAGEALFSRAGKGPRADQLPAIEGFERVMFAAGAVPEARSDVRSVRAAPERFDIIETRQTAQLSAESVGCLARLIYHEAGTEPVRAQIAVAQTVMNRVRSDYFPADVCGVVFQGAEKGEAGCQFLSSCHPTTVRAIDERLVALARDVAESVLSGRARIDGLDDATHFHSVEGTASWALGMTRLAQVGSLVFYRADFVPHEEARQDQGIGQ